MINYKTILNLNDSKIKELVDEIPTKWNLDNILKNFVKLIPKSGIRVKGYGYSYFLKPAADGWLVEASDGSEFKIKFLSDIHEWAFDSLRLEAFLDAIVESSDYAELNKQFFDVRKVDQEGHELEQLRGGCINKVLKEAHWIKKTYFDDNSPYFGVVGDKIVIADDNGKLAIAEILRLGKSQYNNPHTLVSYIVEVIDPKKSSFKRDKEIVIHQDEIQGPWTQEHFINKQATDIEKPSDIKHATDNDLASWYSYYLRFSEPTTVQNEKNEAYNRKMWQLIEKEIKARGKKIKYEKSPGGGGFYRLVKASLKTASENTLTAEQQEKITAELDNSTISFQELAHQMAPIVKASVQDIYDYLLNEKSYFQYRHRIASNEIFDIVRKQILDLNFVKQIIKDWKVSSDKIKFVGYQVFIPYPHYATVLDAANAFRETKNKFTAVAAGEHDGRPLLVIFPTESYEKELKLAAKKVTPQDVVMLCDAKRYAYNENDIKNVVNYLNGKKLSMDYDKLNSTERSIVVLFEKTNKN